LKNDSARQSSFGRGTSEERMGNHPRTAGPMLTIERCRAKKRSGKPCMSPAVGGKEALSNALREVGHHF
jgi:hypothetical protein